MAFLYPESIAWQHVAIPRSKVPGTPGSNTRCDVFLVVEVRSDEAAALRSPSDVAAATASADTPQKSMLALRAEMAHRLALHYQRAYQCASEGGHFPRQSQCSC